MTSSTARTLSSITTVVGRPLRDVSSKARAGSLNLATHFATVGYTGAE